MAETSERGESSEPTPSRGGGADPGAAEELGLLERVELAERLATLGATPGRAGVG